MRPLRAMPMLAVDDQFVAVQQRMESASSSSTRSARLSTSCGVFDVVA